jgi:high-affinity iron transporter
LLILFAAGLFAKGIHEFREFLELEGAWYSTPLWTIDSGPLATGWTADFLQGLFGWSSDPERIRVVAYVVFLVPTLWFYFRGAAKPVAAKTAKVGAGSRLGQV